MALYNLMATYQIAADALNNVFFSTDAKNKMEDVSELCCSSSVCLPCQNGIIRQSELHPIAYNRLVATKYYFNNFLNFFTGKSAGRVTSVALVIAFFVYFGDVDLVTALEFGSVATFAAIYGNSYDTIMRVASDRYKQTYELMKAVPELFLDRKLIVEKLIKQDKFYTNFGMETKLESYDEFVLTLKKEYPKKLPKEQKEFRDVLRQVFLEFPINENKQKYKHPIYMTAMKALFGQVEWALPFGVSFISAPSLSVTLVTGISGGLGFFVDAIHVNKGTKQRKLFYKEKNEFRKTYFAFDNDKELKDKTTQLAVSNKILERINTNFNEGRKPEHSWGRWLTAKLERYKVEEEEEQGWCSWFLTPINESWVTLKENLFYTSSNHHSNLEFEKIGELKKAGLRRSAQAQEFGLTEPEGDKIELVVIPRDQIRSADSPLMREYGKDSKREEVLSPTSVIFSPHSEAGKKLDYVFKD